jgi:electron transfer flavoprotein beta subunit
MRTLLVGIKRVVDFNVRIRVTPDGTGISDDGVKMSINPFDEIALEAALQLKEQGHADEVVIVSIGSDDAQQQLRTALAMGADRGILVPSHTPLEPLATARILHALTQRLSPYLVLLGKQSIDNDNSQTGQMLAALWDRPQATFASCIDIEGEQARVVREVDAGLETIEVDLPAVITADLRLAEPRFVKLPDIMKAKKKPLDILPLEELGIDITPQFRTLSYVPPAVRAKGVMVADVAGLVDGLRQRGVI